MELAGPYAFVRFTTMALATVWTVRGLVRTWLFLNRWERILCGLGFPRPWLRRMVALTLLRATVLDPVNLALLLALTLVWSFRAVL